MTRSTLFLLVSVIFVAGCSTQSEPVSEGSIKRVSSADFQDTVSASVQLKDGFTLDLWAPGPLLKNAVAISFDPSGAAFVSETNRRKSSDIDIRDHPDWMTEDLGLESLADTRDFHLEKLASRNSEQNIWLEDFNEDGVRDYRDLSVQSEIVRKVWDSDGDGRADASCVFADGFNEMLSGVAAGLMYENGDVFLTVAPDVFRLKDTDQDHRADEREVISHGYGIHIAYAGHDMSGLTMGPDGKIYWSIGDMGVHTTSQAGKVWAYPHEGAVMRCNPDGSDFEVFAHGLRNPQELAFDVEGNLISVDNDGDHPGEHERYVHILQGSDSGWRTYWQFGKYNKENEGYKVWMDERLSEPHFPGQAAYILPPIALAHDGPAGLVYNPGTALGTDWNNYFFVSYFTGSSARSRIQAFQLQPKGASYSLRDAQDILVGIVSTGLAWGPEGALYLNDWMESYDKKPEGRIWKLDVLQKNPQRPQTRQLLQTDFSGLTSDSLRSLLGHADMRIRMATQFAIVRKGQDEVFQQTLQNSRESLARRHSVWGLGQLLRDKKIPAESLLAYLSDPDPFIRAQTAKVLGEARITVAKTQLISLLNESSAQVQYFAAESLGKIKATEAFSAITDLLAKTGEYDPPLRHGLSLALSKLASEEQLGSLHQHNNPHVRMGAVLALRHQASPAIAQFLADDQPLIIAEVARAIHDDLSIPEALPALAASLGQNNIQVEAYLRRAINANLRIGDPASAKRLSQYANRLNAPVGMRADALWALGYWGNPPVLDRVEGRYRESSGHPLAEAQLAFGEVAEDLLNSPSLLIKVAAVRAIGRLKYQSLEAEVNRLFLASDSPIELKRASLQSLAALNSPKLTDALDLARQSSDIDLRKDAQALFAQASLTTETPVKMLADVLELGSIAEKQQALLSLGELHDPAASPILNRYLKKLLSGDLEPALQLDLLTAIELSGEGNLLQAVAKYEASRDADDYLAQYAEAMYGGNPQSGQRIFYRNNSAQCIRCHAIEGEGGAVGPDLTQIAAVLSPEQLLLALVDPSARLAPGYGSLRLTLRSGEKLTGVIQAETESFIELKVGNEPLQRIPLSEVVEKQYFPSSMPGMRGVLSKNEIRDVMAFLLQRN